MTYRNAVRAREEAAASRGAPVAATTPSAATATLPPAGGIPVVPGGPVVPVKAEVVGRRPSDASSVPHASTTATQQAVPPQELPTIEQGLQRFYAAAMSSSMTSHGKDPKTVEIQQKIYQHTVQMIAQICDRYALQDPTAYEKT